MELVAGFLLSVVIVLAGILHSKNTNESVTVEKEDKVKKDIQQKAEAINISNWMPLDVNRVSENPKHLPLNPEVKTAEVESKESFKYDIDFIEGIVNHYVSITIIPNSDRSVVEIRQKVEKLSLMSEFVKVRAYISRQPKIYEEYSIPPVDYRNKTAIIRIPIDKKYEFYQLQYSVKGPFKEPEVIRVK